jgi:hypothetical protein
MITSLRWSYTARTSPRPEQEALVVCSLSLSRLGIDRLAEEVGALCGMAEARRWHRSRAELVDRVEAIRTRTCAAWREGLQLTLTSLRRLDDPAGRAAAGNVSGQAA